MTDTTGTTTPLRQLSPELLNPRTACFIGGRWREPSGQDLLPVMNPATEELVGVIAAAGPDEVDDAATAAARAFPEWAATSLRRRLRYLDELLHRVEQRADDLAGLLTAETGMPRTLTGGVQLPFATDVLKSSIEDSDDYPWQTRIGHSLVRQEPAGVVGCITPWNAPLVLVMQKLAPALAAGCTVVLKPSELAPLNTYLLAELLAECDLPPGVVNLVCGTGPVAGEALAAHPAVDVVSLTGSARAGRRVSELAAARAARVSLELGGKSASLVLPDADLPQAVAATVDQVMFNSGQACFAWSRLLVPADRYEEAVQLAAEAAAALPVGDPWDPRTRLGPLIHQAARERVLDLVREAVDDGATLVCGGTTPEQLPRGYFVDPTVLAGAPAQSRAVREEIFGPVLTILAYGSEEDAVRIANDTEYGLHGAVWSADVPGAVAVADRLRTGRVDVNGAPFNLRAPFGGYKRSGTGRELGRWGLDGYCETKSIQLPPDHGDGEAGSPAIQIRSGG